VAKDEFGWQDPVAGGSAVTGPIRRYFNVQREPIPMKRITDSLGNRRIALVVLLIVTVVGVSTHIASRKRRSSSLEQATAMISSSVLLSRQKAIAADVTFGIKYDDEAFRVYRKESGGRWMLDPPDNHFLLPRGVQIVTSGKPTDGWIVIDHAGEVAAGRESALLRLHDREGNRVSVRILRSGQIQEAIGW